MLLILLYSTVFHIISEIFAPVSPLRSAESWTPIFKRALKTHSCFPCLQHWIMVPIQESAKKDPAYPVVKSSGWQITAIFQNCTGKKTKKFSFAARLSGSCRKQSCNRRRKGRLVPYNNVRNSLKL